MALLNEAAETDGGFYTTEGNVTIEGRNVAFNTAAGNGGGAYVNRVMLSLKTVHLSRILH